MIDASLLNIYVMNSHTYHEYKTRWKTCFGRSIHVQENITVKEEKPESYTNQSGYDGIVGQKLEILRKGLGISSMKILNAGDED